MKSLITFITFLTLASFSSLKAQDFNFELYQFPDWDKNYRPGVDTGFSKYGTKSLRGSKKIVLTFDDGPDEVLTPKLLDILKKHEVEATFFVLTSRITPKNYWIIKRMVDEGHTLASHHHDHGNSNAKSKEKYTQELTSTIKTVAQIHEKENARNREIYYRFPYGNYGSSTRDYHHMNIIKNVSEKLFGDNCINFAFWDIDTVDWLADMTSDDIVQNVIANVKGGVGYDFAKTSGGKYIKVARTIKYPLGGGVVLMHDVHKNTILAVDKLLTKLKNEKIEVVNLQDVAEYSYQGKACYLQ